MFVFQLQKNTTPMYRAPEMLDLYQNFPIDQALDIWVSFRLKVRPTISSLFLCFLITDI